MKIKDESAMKYVLDECSLMNCGRSVSQTTKIKGMFLGLIYGMMTVTGAEWSECCQAVNTYARKNKIIINEEFIPEAWKGYFFY